MNTALKGGLLAGIASCIAPIFFITYQVGVTQTSPEAFIGAVFLIAFLFNHIPLCWNRLLGHARGQTPPDTRPKPAQGIHKRSIMVGVAFGLFGILGNYCFGLALLQLGAPLISVIIRTQIFFVMLLGWLLLKEKITLLFCIGVLVSLGGFVVMQSENGFGLYMEGILWGIAGSLIFGGVQILVKGFVAGVNLVLVNHIRLAVGFLALAFVPEVIDEVFTFSLETWALVLLTALAGPLIARSLQLQSLKHIPASVSVLYSMINPVVTLLYAFILFTTLPSWSELIGAAIILLGVSLPLLQPWLRTTT